MDPNQDQEPRPEPPRNPERRDPSDPETSNRGFRFSGIHVLLLLLLFWLVLSLWNTDSSNTIPYSEFKTDLAAGRIQSVAVQQDKIVGKRKTKDGKQESFVTVRVKDDQLVPELQKHKVEYKGVTQSNFLQMLLIWMLPLFLLLLAFSFLMRRGAGSPAMFGFGKSRARRIAPQQTKVTFDDVAGVDEAKEELREVVGFLKNPQRYLALGAKIPRGILLVGPPGTGKTLLGRAVAGEAGVPFYSLSGSEFVEMFVGVGAARVRDLFEQAKKDAPCIIFLDELDAIGRRRGINIGNANDEREQTLNQLLVEMDGFEGNEGVITLSATNRPDVLDRALLRPGRFDRHIVVDLPDLAGRKAILEVHARAKKLGPNVDLGRIAQITPGFSGADLANVLNEAALLSARYDRTAITAEDLDEAVQRILAGPERRSQHLNAERKRRVAFHEAGHALVAHFSEHADPVYKISIVARGRGALGFTMQLPTDEPVLLTQTELGERIRGLLAGRAAEQLVFEEVSTGAANDLERATETAREMVTAHGMSEKLGLGTYAKRDGPIYLEANAPAANTCSEHSAHVIEEEVKRILGTAYDEARTILVGHRPELDRVAAELIRRETLEMAEFEQLITGEPKAEEDEDKRSAEEGAAPATSDL